jgi:hypothetical protein
LIRERFDAEAVESMRRWRHDQIVGQIREAGRADLEAMRGRCAKECEQITAYSQNEIIKATDEAGQTVREAEKLRFFWAIATPLAFVLGVAFTGLLALFWPVAA